MQARWVRPILLCVIPPHGLTGLFSSVTGHGQGASVPPFNYDGLRFNAGTVQSRLDSSSGGPLPGAMLCQWRLAWHVSAVHCSSSLH